MGNPINESLTKTSNPTQAREGSLPTVDKGTQAIKIDGVDQTPATQVTDEKIKKNTPGFFQRLSIVRFAKWAVKHDIVQLSMDVFNAGMAYYSAMTSFSHMVMKCVKNVSKATEWFWNNPQFTSVVSTVSKFASSATTPLLMMGMYQSFIRMFTKDTLSKQIDGGLGVLDAVSGLAGNTVTIGEGLEYAGYISKAALEYATPLNLISLGLAAASVGASIKGWYETSKFLADAKSKTLEEIIDTRGNGLKKMIKMNRGQARDKVNALKEWADNLKPQDILADNLKPEDFTPQNLPKIKAHLKYLEKNITQIRQSVKDQVLEKVYKAVEHRADGRRFAHQLSTATGVSMVAGGTLLATGVAAPIGFGLLAIGSTLSVLKYVDDKLVASQFKEALVIPKKVKLVLETN